MAPTDTINGAKGFAVPKLAQDGSNWIAWKTQTLATLGSNRGVLRHLDGTVRVPAPLPTLDVKKGISEEEEEAYEKAEKRWDDYQQREALIMAQIFTTVPEVLLIEIRRLSTAKQMWDAICAKHENVALTLTIDMRRRLYEMKCEDDANVRTHLETMMQLQERLAGMEDGLSDREFITVILGSLPKSYRPLINAISLSVRHAQVELDLSAVVGSLLEEFERLQIEERQLKAAESTLAAAKGRGKGHGTNDSSKGKYADVECWRCGKTGHIKRDCTEKGKKKDNDRKNLANTATEGDNWAFTASHAGQAMPLETSMHKGSEIDIYDSGASSHMSPDRHRFTNFREIPPHPIAAADKATFNATGVRNMQIAIPNDKTTSYVTIKNVLYCKDLAFTLILLPRCDEAGFAVLLRDKYCTIRDPKGTTVGKIPLIGGLYKVEHKSSIDAANVGHKTLSIDEVHRRMGHISPLYIKELVINGTITSIELNRKSVPTFCTSCAKGKMTRKAIPKAHAGPRSTRFGEKTHTDVWGPTLNSYDGHEYFSTFTDDYTRWSRVSPMKKKSDTLTCYKHYEAWAETQLNAKLKQLQSDQGGEYISDEFDQHLKSKGTTRSLTVHDTPEQNGVAERLNCTLVEHARAMHYAADLPKFLWTESIQHAVWLKNRTTTYQLNGKTPFEMLFNKKPDLSNLPEWGTKVWVLKEDRGKLEAKADEGHWVGYSRDSKSHHVYWPGKRRVTDERNLRFEESVTIPLTDMPKDDQERNEPTQHSSQDPKRDEEDAPQTEDLKMQPQRDSTPPHTPYNDPLEGFEPSDPTCEPQQEGRGHRLRKPSAYVRDIAQGQGTSTGCTDAPAYPKGMQVPPQIPGPPSTGAATSGVRQTLALLALEDPDTEDVKPEGETRSWPDLAAIGAEERGSDPETIEKARKLDDWPEWDVSIRKELDQHERMGTWILVEPPPNANIVGSRMVLHYKRNATGHVASRKLRFVVQGFSQAEGIDYNETFAPTAKLSAIRIIAALAARNDWELEQTDVDGAYLNAPLKETIYMRQAKGYEAPGKEKHVCLLKRAIYGLKQAGREWYELLCQIMLKLGFRRCRIEHVVFCKYNETDALIVAADVDDMTIAGNSKTAIRRFKEGLGHEVKIKDLGDLHWMLGIEVERDRGARTISFSQQAYIRKILERFGLEDAYSLSTPLDPHHKLSLAQCPDNPRQYRSMRDVPYREAIGSLMYAALGTMPDIMFAVTFLSQFMQNPGHAHWEEVKRVFRYLKGTMHWKLTIGMGGHWDWAEPEKRDRVGLEGFMDADGASQYHRHSISGYVFTIDGGAVSWSSKKQSIVTLSNTEGEYIAVTHAAKEALWIRMFLSEITRPLTQLVTIFCDNQSAISVSKNDQFHARMKHINIKYHFVRDIAEHALISIHYCPGSEMLADMLTKPLPTPSLTYQCRSVGLHSA